ncbi:MAG: mechanosensitive ion channel, partial [Armatimonadetes bacterium]|nr:mechanosensitive ion channel [Armatimonadota bacterium]
MQTQTTFLHVLRVLIIVALLVVVKQLLERWVRQTTERLEALPSLREASARRSRTILVLAANALKYVLFLVAGITLLGELGVNLSPLLTSAGIAGLAVGFGAQSLVKDVVSGFFIIFEAQFAVGDLVEINGVLGNVEEVGLRITRLKAATGEVRFFPNGSISTVSNFLDKSVPYQINVPIAGNLGTQAHAAADASARQFQSEFSVFGGPFTLADTVFRGLDLKVLIYQVKVLPTQKALFETRFPAWLKLQLQKESVSLPEGEEIVV